MTTTQRPVRFYDWWSLPEYWAWRWLQRIFVLVVMLVVIPFLVVGIPALRLRGLLEARNNQVRAEIQTIDALKGPVRFTAAEQRFAASFLNDQIIYSANFPIWDAPNDSGLFGLSTSDPDWIPLSEAMANVRTAADERARAGTPDSQSITNALNAFGRVGDGQGIDRAVVVYHRALLDLWRGNHGSTAQELDKLFARINEDAGSAQGRSAPERRAQGVRVAGHYMNAHALLGEAPTAQDQRNALAELDAALGIAQRLQRRNTSSSPFITLRPQVHVVAMSTAPIVNDRMALLAASGHFDQAVAVAQELIAKADYASDDAALAGNLIMLTAIEPSEVSLEDRRTRVETLSAALERADPEGLAIAARIRADVGRVIAGSDVVTRPSAECNSPARQAFQRIHARADFGCIDLPGAQAASRQLDAWLFIREWRRSIEKGDFTRFEQSFRQLRTLEDIPMDFFNEWRTEVMRERSTRFDGDGEQLAIGRAEQQQVYALRIWTDLGSEHVVDALRYSLGKFWVLWSVLWFLLFLAALVLLFAMEIYRAHFVPHHHVDRTRVRRNQPKPAEAPSAG